MSTDPQQWARFVADSDGCMGLVEQEDAPAAEAPDAGDAGQEEVESPRLEPAKVSMPGRLGERRPEFQALSDELAEINRRSRSGRRL